MKKLITGILVSLTILIFGLSISIMFLGASAYKNNELFFIFKYSFSIIPTDSMVGDQPDSLEPGDIAILQRGLFENVEVGDVVVYQDRVTTSDGIQSILIIHRVIEIRSDGRLITKGDNPLNTEDPHPVTSSTYQGTLAAKITFLKPIVNLMIYSRSLIFLALTAVLVILLIWELAHIYSTIYKPIKKENIEKHEAEIEQIKKKEQDRIYQEILEEEKAKIKQSK